MLLFRDNDYRPIHSSIVTAVNFKQSAKKKSKEISLKTQDSIGGLDFQFPYFDIGQENGMPSLVAHYRRYDITNYARYFTSGLLHYSISIHSSALTKIARPTMENTYHDTTNV